MMIVTRRVIMMMLLVMGLVIPQVDAKASLIKAAMTPGCMVSLVGGVIAGLVSFLILVLERYLSCNNNNNVQGTKSSCLLLASKIALATFVLGSMVNTWLIYLASTYK